GRRAQALAASAHVGGRAQAEQAGTREGVEVGAWEHAGAVGGVGRGGDDLVDHAPERVGMLHGVLLRPVDWWRRPPDPSGSLVVGWAGGRMRPTGRGEGRSTTSHAATSLRSPACAGPVDRWRETDRWGGPYCSSRVGWLSLGDVAQLARAPALQAGGR